MAPENTIDIVRIVGPTPSRPEMRLVVNGGDQRTDVARARTRCRAHAADISSSRTA